MKNNLSFRTLVTSLCFSSLACSASFAQDALNAIALFKTPELVKCYNYAEGSGKVSGDKVVLSFDFSGASDSASFQLNLLSERVPEEATSLRFKAGGAKGILTVAINDESGLGYYYVIDALTEAVKTYEVKFAEPSRVTPPRDFTGSMRENPVYPYDKLRFLFKPNKEAEGDEKVGTFEIVNPELVGAKALKPAKKKN